MESLEIELSAEIMRKIPNFKLGIIVYKDITVGDSPQMVKGRLQLFQESIYFELEDKNVTDLPGIQEWSSIFKTLVRIQTVIVIQLRHYFEGLRNRIILPRFKVPLILITFSPYNIKFQLVFMIRIN